MKEIEPTWAGGRIPKARAARRARHWKGSVMVNAIGTSRKSPIRTGEVELLEFFAQRRACDDRDRAIEYSDVRALGRGVRNALLMVTPFWVAIAWWLTR